MGLTYTRVGNGPVDGSAFHRAAKSVNREINRELGPVGEAAKGEAQGFIKISGTARLWKGSFQGRTHSGRGRIDTGNMMDSIDYRVYHGTYNGIDIGWLRHYEDYFGAQETGFSAGGFRPSQTVEGMGLFAHLNFYMRDKVGEALDRAIDRITNGL